MAEAQPLTERRIASFGACGMRHQYEFEMARWPSYRLSGRLSRAWGPVASAALASVAAEGQDKATSFVEAGKASISRQFDPEDRARLAAHLVGAASVLREAMFFDLYRIDAVRAPYRYSHSNPDTKAASPLWYRSGVIDAIVTELRTGQSRILKHVVTDDPIEPGSIFWHRATMDNRVAADVLGAKICYGVEADAVVYAAVSKCQLSLLKATPPQHRKFKADGSLYASQRSRDESPVEFYDRCVAAILSDVSRHFRTIRVAWNHGRIEAHLRDAWMVSQVIRESRLQGWAVRNTESCHRVGVCPYWKVCSGSARIEDDAYFRTPERLDEEVPLQPMFITDALKEVAVEAFRRA